MIAGALFALTLRPGTAVEDMLPEASASAQAMGRVLSDFQLIDDLVLLVDPPDGAKLPPADLSAAANQLAERMNIALAEQAEVAGVRGPESETTPAAQGAAIRAYAQAHGGWLLDVEARAALAAALEPGALDAALGRFRRSLEAAGAEAGGPTAADPLNLAPTLLGFTPGVGALPGLPGEAGPGDAADAADADRAPAAPAAATPAPPTIRIAATGPANDLPYAASLVDAVTRAADEANADGLGLTLTGAHAIANYTARSVRRDMVVSLAVTMVSLSLLFLLVYRSGHTLPLLLGTVNGGLVVAFGLYAVFGGQLSPVTAVCGAVLAGLGIDYGVHLLAARHFSAAEPPGQPTASGEEPAGETETAKPAETETETDTTAERVAPALIAACVTSCVGFGAVAFAGVRALTEFAVLGVLGLLATLAMTLLFLPAALQLVTPARADRPLTRPRLDPARVIRRVVRNPRPPLFAVSVLGGMVAAILFFGGDVRFASDLEAMHAQPNPPLEAQARLVGDPDGPGHLLVLVTADPLDQPPLSVRVREVEAALGALVSDDPHAPGVTAVIGPGAFLPLPEADILPAEAAESQSPNRRLPPAAEALARFDAAAEAAGLAPAGFAGFRDTLAGLLEPGPPPGRAALAATPADRLLPRQDPASPDAAPTAALVLVQLSHAWELMPDRSALLGDVRAAVAPTPGATATGLAVVGADMQEQIASVLPRLLAIAALAVVLWLAIVFRNPWDVFLALGPAVAGISTVFAAVLLSGTELQAANLIALPLTLGLGVDDGIFLVHLARGVRRASESPTAGITPATLESAAAAPVHAVLITSITTIAAFGSLWFTRSPAIASLGLLSAVGVTACLLVSVFGLLPALALQQRWLLARRRRLEQAAGR